MPSRYLMNELTISAMAGALAPFENIDLDGFRLACYRAAGIAPADAAAHDDEAYRRELLRRAALAAYAEGRDRRPIFAGLAGTLAFIAPSLAQARPVVAPDHEWPILALSFALMFGAPILLIGLTIVLNVLENRPRPLPKGSDCAMK